MNRTHYFFLIFSFIFISKNVNAQPGTLDPTFDTDGKNIADLGDDYGYGMAIQPDGKIVIAGYTYGSTDVDFGLARFNVDGTPDNTFNTDGEVTTDFGGYDQFAGGVAIQSDGKIVVAGTTFNGLNNDFMVIRYNSDGSLDNTFDGDGIAIVDIGISVDYGRDVVMQADGKILVCGSTDDGGDIDFVVLRFATDGSLDPSFDTDGIVQTDIASYDDFARSITVQADGKIIAAGYGNISVVNVDFFAARYNTDGSLDLSFDFDGKLTTAIGTSEDYGRSVSVHTDGKVIISGHTSNGTDMDIAIARYNADGSPDLSFDVNGEVITPVGVFDDYSFSGAVQSDGKIVVSGYTSDGAQTDFLLMRYNVDGSIDNTFDTDGIVTTDFGLDDYGQSMALQTDGKIVVTGYAYNGSNSDFAIARYENECIVDTSITEGVFTLTANQAGATYQWLDCDNGMVEFFGETNQTFTVGQDGNYAVAITANGCTDTSSCQFAMGPFGFDENNSNLISVSPNPTTGNLTLTSKTEIQNTSLKITDISGKIIYIKEDISGNNFLIDLSNQPAGIYFLEVNDEEMTQRIKVVKS